jgi:glycine/D-amino acid oxidase-like deaminating enzyme
MMRGFSTTTAAASQVYDVAIVGAGMVGAAVAALLRKCNCTAQHGWHGACTATGNSKLQQHSLAVPSS